VFSDLRQHDWNVETESDTAPNKLLAAIGDAVEGCYVVDTGDSNDQNLSVVSVRPLEFPIAGKVIPFEVVVKNNGSQNVEQVRVMFQVNEGQPEYETIANLAPGRSEVLEFRYVFPFSAASELEESLNELNQSGNTPRGFPMGSRCCWSMVLRLRFLSAAIRITCEPLMFRGQG